jgi:hypothetical protein
MNTHPLTLPPNPTPEDLLAQGRAYARRRNSANYRIRTRRQLAALERSRSLRAFAPSLEKNLSQPNS